MIIIMNRGAGQKHIDEVQNLLHRHGFNIHFSQGVERTIIGVIGDRTHMSGLAIEAVPGVERVVPVLEPYKLASRAFNPEDTIIKAKDLEIGGNTIHVIAGPCAVESKEQLYSAARSVKSSGATILRGGAFKPRTSPYSFQGMKEEGLKLLAAVGKETNMPVITEVMDVVTLPAVAEYADILQVGARNMQNFTLLQEVARVMKPVLLKRSPSSTIEEWLLAAEYILSEGNNQVILCERGIRTFESYTRNTLDLTAIPVLKHLTHLPVIVDPSHAIGKWRFVKPMAVASICAGADGLMIEVHPDPARALCDGPQSLTPSNFKATMDEICSVAKIMNRTVGCEH